MESGKFMINNQRQKGETQGILIALRMLNAIFRMNYIMTFIMNIFISNFFMKENVILLSGILKTSLVLGSKKHL